MYFNNPYSDFIVQYIQYLYLRPTLNIEEKEIEYSTGVYSVATEQYWYTFDLLLINENGEHFDQRESWIHCQIKCRSCVSEAGASSCVRKRRVERRSRRDAATASRRAASRSASPPPTPRARARAPSPPHSHSVWSDVSVWRSGRARRRAAAGQPVAPCRRTPAKWTVTALTAAKQPTNRSKELIKRARGETFAPMAPSRGSGEGKRRS